MFNPTFKDNVQGGNIQGIVHLQNQNYLVTGSLYVLYKHEKNPNNSHNYHAQNHDEIKFNQGNSKKKHIMTLNTRTVHTQNPVL